MQLQKQHKQRIDIELFDRRNAMLLLVHENKYEDIEYPSARFLFNVDIYRQITQLYVMKLNINSRLLFDEEVADPLEKSDYPLYLEYKYTLKGATNYYAQEDDRDAIKDVLKRVLDRVATEQISAAEIEKHVLETVDLCQELSSMGQQTYFSMSDYIEETLS